MSKCQQALLGRLFIAVNYAHNRWRSKGSCPVRPTLPPCQGQRQQTLQNLLVAQISWPAVGSKHGLIQFPVDVIQPGRAGIAEKGSTLFYSAATPDRAIHNVPGNGFSDSAGLVH